MSLLPWICSITSSNDANNSAKSFNTVVSFLYFAIFALAIFLAIRDSGTLPGTTPKIWLFLFAIFSPELYVIIHGLSSSSMGIPFFSETPVELPPSLDGALTPSFKHSHDTDGGGSMDLLANEIQKASANARKISHDAMSSLSSATSSL